MRSHSIPNRSTPERYVLLLLMPLRLAGLVTLVVMSAVLAASLQTGPFGIPLVVILLSWFFKYSFALLDSLTLGQTEAPVLSIEMIMSTMGEFRWLVPLLLSLAAFFSSRGSTLLLGHVGAAAAAAGLIACMPAMLVIQGWSGRLSRSLNPHSWKLVAQTLGRDYVWMVACTLFIAAACVAAPEIWSTTPSMLRIGLLLYGWLAVIAVAGGTLHTDREALEQIMPQIVAQPRAVTTQELEAERERWIDSIYASWRGKAADTAYQLAMERIERSADPLQELQWLSDRTMDWEPPHLWNRIAGELLMRLLAEDRDGEALRLVKARLAIDAAFRLEDPAVRARLARLATQWGDRHTADSLMGESAS